jgi:hypothetical protein
MFKYWISSNVITAGKWQIIDITITTTTTKPFSPKQVGNKSLVDELNRVTLLSGKLMMLWRVENSSEGLKHNSLDNLLI